MPFTVKVDGIVHSADDLTVAEATAIEAAVRAAGVESSGWGQLNPFRSMPVAAAMLATFLVRLGRSDAEAQAEVSNLTIRTINRVFGYVEDDDLPDMFADGIPKGEGGPATSGSAGAPSGSDGPRT